jgi:hypothetical protein
MLSTTRICSFSLEICCAFKSEAQFVFTITKNRRKKRENVHEPLGKGASNDTPPESGEPMQRIAAHTWSGIKKNLRKSMVTFRMKLGKPSILVVY